MDGFLLCHPLDIKTETSTSTCEILDARGEAETVSNLGIKRSPGNDADSYKHSARGKKRLLTTNEAIESPAKKGKTYNLTLDYWVKLACRQDLGTHFAESKTGSDMNQLESED